MTRLVCIAMPGNEPMAERLAALVQGELATLETRQFPDGESYLRLLTDAGPPRPICLGIHGLSAGDSFKALSALAERIVTTNTVAHPSNAINLSGPVAAGVIEMVQGTRTAAP